MVKNKNKSLERFILLLVIFLTCSCAGYGYYILSGYIILGFFFCAACSAGLTSLILWILQLKNKIKW